MLKIGEYTRINGKIGKVKDIVLNSNNYEDSGIYLENEKFVLGKEEIYKLKASYNIIDLIEEGDYVNGQLVYYDEESECLGQNFVDADSNYYFERITKGGDYKIKTILTKEQYENNCYKVEDI